ncbi:MAG TPA: serine/threonine-protein kinase, partial [Candidatus Melainabacteria bacterium]|nr:serine/threonine-protein kinase [Candidatus Melainabacteria bacterium]
NGRDYLLLDFIAGNTLRQQLAQYGPISESEALEYALDMIALVSYLHDLNPPIIHRDLSPDNLVVKEDGSLVLIDFGAANELIGTATGTLVGKQAYMAPEQFRGKAGKASDIYGIGATLFFLLTGVDPNPLTCSSPRKTNKEVSPVTDSIVASCTEQKIEDRAQSLQDLHARIQTVIEEGGGAILDICPSGEN